MRHFAAEKNFGLAACRQTKKENWTHIFLTKNIIPAIFVEVKDNCNTFPLYTYPDQTDLLNTGRTPNLDPKIVAKIAESIGLEFEPEKSGEPDKFAPIDLLDYIYAVLHCPAYREKYREFLKADFPRVPYPENTGQFHRLTTNRCRIASAASDGKFRLLGIVGHLSGMRNGRNHGSPL